MIYYLATMHIGYMRCLETVAKTDNLNARLTRIPTDNDYIVLLCLDSFIMVIVCDDLE